MGLAIATPSATCIVDGKGGHTMPEFIDVHTTMQGVTPEALAEA